ncbi:Zinc/iron permease [Apiospora arundinis]|uniref:Zinc/iron permease n=1 Tax=Apiospora arundinis TaxID=335852 RepID=A0ABR2I3H6_9PEZI
MAGAFVLLAQTVAMALASFLAGALPLSMTLSQAQLRLISSIGVGLLVGTSLIVIIPEGVEAISDASLAGHNRLKARVDDPPTHTPSNHPPEPVPTFYVGLSLIMGFVLMFLIDRLPRHASENFQQPPAPRHISLSNLAGTTRAVDEEESEGFLGSLAPSPKQSRSLATTIGLVIHAAADGIAMGASATAPNMQLGFIVFIAIMVHKAPAAFGLTSVLLKQGLSKRAARGHLIVFSLASPFGAWATYILVKLLGGGSIGADGENHVSQWWTGMLLLFSGGTFLYVAMHAMQEGDGAGHESSSGPNGYADSHTNQRKQSKPQMRDTLATGVGMLIPMLTQFGHHH